MNQNLPTWGNQKHVYDLDSLAKSLKDYLDISLLTSAKTKATDFPDKIFFQNQELWNYILEEKSYPGQILNLKKFKILEWIPQSPGLFFTTKAEYLRKDAYQRGMEYQSQTILEKSLSKSFIEFRPNEKMGMVLGGYGSLRLAPKNVNGEEIFILCASSSAVSHEGIPLLLRKPEYQKIISVIKESKIPEVSLIGQLKVLPEEKSLIKLRYDQNVPKYCLEVLDLEMTNTSNEGMVSIAVTYASSMEDYHNNFSYSFCSFPPTSIGLKQGVDWLRDYAERYSHKGNPFIVGDFDEFYNHFENVSFPIRDVANGNTSIEALKQFSIFYHYEIKQLNMGDIISNNTGNIVKGNTGNTFVGNIGDINITDSFNKVKEKFGKEAADALAKVAEIIQKENNPEAKELFESFNDELKKEQPKKSLLKTLWTGITTAIPLLKTSVDIFDKVSSFIG